MLSICLAWVSLYEKNENGKLTTPADYVPRLCPEKFPLEQDGQADCDNWDGSTDFIFTGQVITNEILCTFIFVSVILMVKIKEEHIQVTKDGVSGALAVAFTLLGMVSAGGRLGACYNPAVATTLTTNAVIYLDNDYDYLTHYFKSYFFGPLIGGFIAGVFHAFHKKFVLLKGSEFEEHHHHHQHESQFSHEAKQGLIGKDLLDEEDRSTPAAALISHHTNSGKSSSHNDGSDKDYSGSDKSGSNASHGNKSGSNNDAQVHHSGSDRGPDV